MRNIFLLFLLVAGCGSNQSDALTVFSASSLTDVAPALLAQSDQAGTLVFGGSNHLAVQIADGAPADVLLTADLSLLSLDAETHHALAFAQNHLVLAVPIGNPSHLTGPKDLARPELAIAICAKEVPCGKATLDLNYPIAVDTYETSVRSVATKLAMGEVDLGVVYATDTQAQPSIETLWPLEATCPCVTYHAIALTEQGVPFVKSLGKEKAQALLASYGFSQP
jgi:molybdate transport system substrate-binding protein